ncbi:PAQR family membrane homeostasis protein TrhA [Bythopirellula goksoeyrii]|uniref:Hemolysin-III related n=1 Tax=Bythopirellula goksoeyrii TaxID=1400387 RepID=A0A5B9QDA4_9BACT|nr:hemolysin III family protein [Bythopirellula goksoeyrii]QEG35600.1 hemolysin-III related [Bythopirellula goksoeyrii]
MANVISISGFSDPFSSLSHLLGAGVFAVLSVFLVRRGRGDAWRVFSLVLFCLGAVALLTISGVNHLIARQGTTHLIMQRLDHAAIFVLIACSFTPIHMILFHGWGRWGALAIIWAIAFLGITLKSIFFVSISESVGTAMYIGMGWIGLFSWFSIVRRYGFDFAQPIMWGGLAYTIGAILDILQWPVVISGVIQWHEVFHVAVLLGLACHWSFIYQIANWPIDTPHRNAPRSV